MPSVRIRQDIIVFIGLGQISYNTCSIHRAKELGLALASEADFEFLPSTFSIAVDTSGGRLHCLLELHITLILSLAQRSYRQSKKFFLNLSPSFREAGAPSSGNKKFKMSALFKSPVRAAPLVRSLTTSVQRRNVALLG